MIGAGLNPAGPVSAWLVVAPLDTAGLGESMLGRSGQGFPTPGLSRRDTSRLVTAGQDRAWLGTALLPSSGLGGSRHGKAGHGPASLAGHGVSRRVAAWLVRAWLGRTGLGFPGRGEAPLNAARPVSEPHDSAGRGWAMRGRTGPGWTRPGMARRDRSGLGSPLADIRQTQSLSEQSLQIAARYEAVRALRRSASITYVSDFRRAA